MSPKLHRRTPPSAHTYRLLIFKELQNSLAFAVLFTACKSFCLRKQRSGIMCCFSIFVKHFSLTFSLCLAVEPLCSSAAKKRDYAAFGEFGQASLQPSSHFAPPTDRFVRQPQSQRLWSTSNLSSTTRGTNIWRLSSRPRSEIPSFSAAFTQR